MSGRVVPAPAGSWDGTHSWRGSWEKAPAVERSSAADNADTGNADTGNADADRARADWATTDPQTTADTGPLADWQRVEGAAPNLTEFSSLFWIDDDESVVKRDRRSPRLLGLATALLLSVLAAVFTAFMLTDSPDSTEAVTSGPGPGLAPAEAPAGSSEGLQTDEPIGVPTDDAQVTAGSENSDQVPGPLEATGAAESVDDPPPVDEAASRGIAEPLPVGSPATAGPTTPSGSPTSGGTGEPAAQPSSQPSSQPSPSPSESDSGGLLSSVVGLIGWLLG